MSSGWLYFEIGLHLVAVIGAGGGDPLPTGLSAKIPAGSVQCNHVNQHEAQRLAGHWTLDSQGMQAGSWYMHRQSLGITSVVTNLAFGPSKHCTFTVTGSFSCKFGAEDSGLQNPSPVLFIGYSSPLYSRMTSPMGTLDWLTFILMWDRKSVV